MPLQFASILIFSCVIFLHLEQFLYKMRSHWLCVVWPFFLCVMVITIVLIFSQQIFSFHGVSNFEQFFSQLRILIQMKSSIYKKFKIFEITIKIFLPQSRTFWTDRRLLGHFPLRMMLILSDIALVVPWAQQEPQYWGMCWLRVTLAKLPFPGTSLQSHCLGIDPVLRYSWGRGVFLFKIEDRLYSINAWVKAACRWHLLLGLRRTTY